MKNKILLYNSGGGIGDTIQLFPLILSINKHFMNSDLYYLGAHENHFITNLKEYNIKIKDLNLDIKYFGFRWWHLLFSKKKFLKKNIEKFDIIIDLQSKLRNTIILKKIPHDYFYSSTYKFKFCTNKNKYSSKDHIKNLNKFLDTNIIISRFNIKNLSDKYKSEANRLLPDKNYIGFSLTQGNKYRKKSWSINNFILLANKISEKNKVPVFFVEKKEVQLINLIKSNVPKALFPEHHSTISCPALVTALSSKLELAITIDNGVMHMMGLANIPLIALFGPTNSDKFSPTGASIKVLDSKKIYNSNDVNSITVYDVFKLI